MVAKDVTKELQLAPGPPRAAKKVSSGPGLVRSPSCRTSPTSPSRTSHRSAKPSALLEQLNGSSGPDFFTEGIFAGGVTLGVVYSFTGLDVIQFTSESSVAVISYDTVAGNLAGQVDPVQPTAHVHRPSPAAPSSVPSASAAECTAECTAGPASRLPEEAGPPSAHPWPGVPTVPPPPARAGRWQG